METEMRGMMGVLVLAVAGGARAGVGAAEGAAEEEGESTLKKKEARICKMQQYNTISNGISKR